MLAIDEYGRIIVDGYSESGKISVNDYGTISETGVIAYHFATDYSDWKYRAKLKVKDHPEAEAQAKFTLNHQTGMKSDFADIRFSTIDGVNIPYWIESKTDSVESVVWLKVPAGQKRLFVYWGCSAAESESNGEDVFKFFTDFSRYSQGTLLSDDILDVSGAPTVNANGYLELSGNDYVKSTGKYGLNTVLEVYATATDQDVMFAAYRNDANDRRVALYNSDSSAPYGQAGDYTGYNCLNAGEEGTEYNHVDTSTDFRSGFNRFGVARYPTRGDVDYYLNDQIIKNASWDQRIPTEDLHAAIYVWNSSVESTMTVQWMFVRDRTATVPVISLIAADFNPHYHGYVWNHMKYSMRVNVVNAPATTAEVEYDMPYQSGMNSDFSDVRFATLDGEVIEYWRESYTAGITAKYYLKLPANTTQFKVYFGNTLAVYAGDPHSVFVSFIDGSTKEDYNEVGSIGIYTDQNGDDYTSVYTGTGNEYLWNNLPYQMDKYRMCGKLAYAGTTGFSHIRFYNGGMGGTSVSLIGINYGSLCQGFNPYDGSAGAYAANPNYNQVSDSETIYHIIMDNCDSILGKNDYYENGVKVVSQNTMYNALPADAYYIGRNTSGEDAAVRVSWFFVGAYLDVIPTFVENTVGYNIGYCLYDWSGFNKQSTITIENASYTPVPAKLTFTKADYSLMSNAADLRFCDTDGNYLPYWIGHAQSDVTAWVIVPSCAHEIFMRCGNSSAISESDHIALGFDFAENWMTGVVDTGTWTVNGNASVTNEELVVGSATNGYDRIISKFTYGEGYSLEMEYSMPDTTAGWHMLGFVEGTASTMYYETCVVEYYGQSNTMFSYDGDSANFINTGADYSSGYHVLKLNRKGKGAADIWFDGQKKREVQSGATIGNLYVGTQIYDGGDYTRIKWMVIREYTTDIEPALAISSEVDLGGSGGGEDPTFISMVWNGSAWAMPVAVKTWTGSSWADVVAIHYWTGSGWLT